MQTQRKQLLDKCLHFLFLPGRIHASHCIVARCILPDIIAYYETEEGQREFREWKAKRGAEAAEGKKSEKA